MSSYIEVTSLSNNLSWQKQVTNEELELVRSYCDGRETVDLMSATFQTVRTNNLNNFAKDFFLPTLVNRALKVQNVVVKIFAIIGAFILDVVTFPIRLLRCLPRVVENSSQEEHPLRQYLRANNVDPRLFEADYIKIKTVLTTSGNASTRTNANGRVVRTHDVEHSWRKQYVNFIDMPNCVDELGWTRSGSSTNTNVSY